ncbi:MULTISPECIES: DUF6212 domain-containing protein [Pseudomonas]|nr:MULTISPECIES: DUF6212 domain-containing protein [Pseudomonas]MBH3377817.1 hypothetical protein [Pseudomonas asiatica]
MNTNTTELPAKRLDASNPAYKIGTTVDDFEEICRLDLPSQIEIIAVKGNALSIEFLQGDKAQRLNSLPNNLVGFIALSEKSHCEIEEISKHWELHGHKLGPACLKINSISEPDSLNSWLIDQIIKSNQLTSVRNVKLMRELTQLRIAHEESQRAFYNLERFAEANFELQRKLAVVLEPSSQAVTLDSKTHTITQLLPSVSVGVSDIGLHLSTAPKGVSGKLEVSLTAVETATQVGHWTIPTNSLKKGWIQLSLQNTLGIDEQSLSMTLKWSGGDSVSVSMGCAHPDPKWNALVLGQPSNRTLAIKIWRGLPSVSPTISPNSLAISQAEPNRWLVDENALKEIQSHDPTTTEFVKYIENLNAVLVHPNDTNAVLGKLAASAPKGARHFCADIEHGNAHADPIEYAIAVTDPHQSRSKNDTEKFKPGYISDWIALSAGANSQIHLFLPTPLEATGDIYLATRVRKGASNENCWAYFKKIRAMA